MDIESLVLAVLLGVVQGVLEWLPVSSEGGVALALSLVTGESGGVST
ncbi:UDP-diphosphatase, partial [Halobacteriales archaeon QH_7_68_42]